MAMLPFLFEAMLDFHSRTTPELVWTKEVVNIRTYGTDSDEKQERSQRVSDYMNYQVSETIPHWRPEQENFSNDTMANRLLGRAYRAPWHL